MIRTDWLRTFILVLEHGSFSHAANQLGISAVAVSKQITLLEHTIGSALFERTTRKLRLTSTGVMLHKQSENFIREQIALDDWLKDYGTEPRGPLRVLCQYQEQVDQDIMPKVATFLKAYPNIELEIDIQAKRMNIDRDKADIYWGVGGYLGDDYPGFKRKKIRDEDIGVFASPDYLAKYGEPKCVQDLASHFLINHLHNPAGNALIVSSDVTCSTTQTVLGTHCLYPMTSRLRGISSGLHAAAEGLGLVNSLLSNSVLQPMLASHKLQPVLMRHWLRLQPSYAYFHQVKQEQPKVRAFLNHFLDEA